MTSKQQCARRYYLKHRNKVRAYNDAWAKANPEAIKRIKRNWKLRNQHKVLLQARKDQRRARSKNPDRMRLKARMDYWKHREKRILTARKWAKNNPVKRAHYAHKRRTYAGNSDNCIRKIHLLKLERFCHWCCVQLINANRTIDHVIPLSRGGQHIPDNLVAACRKCNCSKKEKLVEEWTWEEAA